MFHLSNVLKYVIVIYVFDEASQVFSLPRTRKSKFKIDDFIDKLLSSKKFDMLADKIAQKAVERMIDLKPELRLTKEFTSQINGPQKVPVSNISYNTDVHLEETVAPLKNLSLKFTHFTKAKANIDQRSAENNARAKETKTTNAPTTIAVIKKAYSEENEKPNIISDLEAYLQDNTDNKTESIPRVNSESDNDSSSNQNKTTKEETDTDGSLSAENKKNAELSAENELSDKHKINEDHPNKVTSYSAGVASDFDRKVRKDRALFSNESNEVIVKPPAKRVHREGNKLYTFQSSSDYDEYHEELNRVEKNRNVFV